MALWVIAGLLGIGRLHARHLMDELTLNPNQAAPVTKLVVRREVTEIKLSNGAQIPCRPVNGRVWAALFVGNVKMTFNPTTEIERDQLMRRFKDSLITADGKAVLFDFTDSPRGSCRVKPHSEGKIFQKTHGRFSVF